VSCSEDESVAGKTVELRITSFHFGGCCMTLVFSSPRASNCYPDRYPKIFCDLIAASKPLILLVGAPRFELGTPSPPDWCANRAALRSVDAAGL
jgi:hypothetical protein